MTNKKDGLITHTKKIKKTHQANKSKHKPNMKKRDNTKSIKEPKWTQKKRKN